MKNIKGWGLMALLFGSLLFLASCGGGKTEQECIADGKKFVQKDQDTNDDGVAVGSCEECTDTEDGKEQHSTDGKTCELKPVTGGEGAGDGAANPPAEEIGDVKTWKCKCNWAGGMLGAHALGDISGATVADAQTIAEATCRDKREDAKAATTVTVTCEEVTTPAS